jgi:flagellar hook assembly protein FlgD
VSGAQSFSNVVNVEFGNAADVALDNNFPNPTNGKTTFTFTVPFSSRVKLEVYDLMGNVVKTVYDNMVAGQSNAYAVEWDGRHNDGTDVASGSYMYKLTVGDEVLSKTLTIVR